MTPRWAWWTALCLGHSVYFFLLASAVVFGLALDGAWIQVMAAGLLMAAIVAQLSRRTPGAVRGPAGHAGLALWSFLMANWHGAGLMLVPVLMPLCVGDGSPGAFAGNPVLLAFLAVAGHAAAMIAATGGLALAGRAARSRLLRR
ncbi:hypothetical protein FN976_22730 [Caenimonas sedimenti]|uniref:Uncharacterized protein n=2 Tax=Caenimonas sedimenti TaxID=2596921 RepID=A0A562ZIN3_9BURK|nr:hypothetical protein FN976_22730 [Caenimonas sedimenti]